jgi:hypothetical protein
MPEAAGAVAAAAVADRMLGPKEHRQLAIALVSIQYFQGFQRQNCKNIFFSGSNCLPRQARLHAKSLSTGYHYYCCSIILTSSWTLRNGHVNELYPSQAAVLSLLFYAEYVGLQRRVWADRP